MNRRIMVACRLLGWLGLVCLAACGSVRPGGPPDRLDCGLERFVVRDIYEGLGGYRLRGEPGSFNVLALSAGGEFGAYGAGFLSGWRSVPTPAVPSRRDDIQVVTGVSTGAILATHAFLGKDEEIERLYRSLSGTRIYRSRGLLSLIWANSVMEASGKDRLVEQYVPGTLIDEVAAAAGSASLVLGAVDLDSGRFLRIDMVKLARTVQPVELRDACYRAVIGAASAIPIAFAPKFIDDMMLVDGAARRHLFITEPPAAVKQPNVQRRLFSFVHGDLNVGCTRTDNGVLQIAGRTSSVLLDQSLRDSLWMMDALAREPVAEDPGKPMFRTYYAAAAAAARVCAPTRVPCEAAGGSLIQGEDMFCQPFMNCLADKGREDGKAYASGGRPWLQLRDLDAFITPDCGARDAAHRTLVQ